MADDTSYNTFLAKANEDPNSGSRSDTYSASTSQARSRFDPSTTNPSSAVPSALQNLPDTPYVSDTDSDWEPVFFSYAADTLPSLEQFKQVLRSASGVHTEGGDRLVEELSVEDFDPRGQYKEVVERVKEAGKEEGAGVRGNLPDDKERSGGKGVKVFRVEVGRTRVEYYVLTVGERKLVGVMAKAVES